MHSPSRRELLASGLAATALSSASLAADSKEAKSPLFQLGLVSYMVSAKWDLKTTLEICKKTGIAAVECRTSHAHKVEPTLSATERKDVRKQLEDSGIVFWGCGSTCEFHAAEASVVQKNIDECKKFIELVHDLGGRGVKVRPNGVPKGGTLEKTLEQIGKALVTCGNEAEGMGVEIWVEVHGSITQEPANMKAIMEQCGHKSVGLTWNSNPTDVKKGSIAESFAMLKPWIRSCHINDLYKDAAKVYPYRELFRLLKEMDYDRYTLIEVGKTPADPAAGEEFLRYYKALWLELLK